MLAETDANGNLIRDYLWMDATPIAQVEAGEKLAYLHTDHLNTPRLATNPQGQVVWRWEGTAFGETYPNEDVDGNGIKITINLRFPGQYYDAESGLHYNWNRYYDPKVGRYISFDPIGVVPGLMPVLLGGSESFTRPVSPWFATEMLAAHGLNHPYAYVRNNPNRWADPSGLIDLGICGSTALQRLLILDGSFGPACQRHDNCYATCGKTKWSCDYQLLKDTQAECEKLPKGSIARSWCFSKSTEFFLAVGNYGQDAYDKAQ